MSDAQKDRLKAAAGVGGGASKSTLKQAALSAGQTLLANPSAPTFGIPPNVSIGLNAKLVTRFPIPLTVGACIGVALGAVAMMRGHRVVGLLLLAMGGAGVGAAAAAPELNAALTKMRGAL